jgi:hypothetical protein
MKRLGLLLFLILAVALMGGSALAQNTGGNYGGDNSVYFVTYFSNANTPGAPNAAVRFVNDGDTEANLYADYYVFDDSQELQECCSCQITPDGVNSEWINQAKTDSLTGNTVTGKKLTRGVLKVISDSTGNATDACPTPGLRGTAVHVQNTSFNSTVSYGVTETPFADSNLVPSEQSQLQNLCSYAQVLGSGKGVCSCTPEDSDF